MTLLSAALQEYPDLRVVLLIDDPPEPKYAQPAAMLAAAQAAAGRDRGRCSPCRCSASSAPWPTSTSTSRPRRRARRSTTSADVAGHYEFAATWLATSPPTTRSSTTPTASSSSTSSAAWPPTSTTNAVALRAAAAEGAELTHRPPALPLPAPDLDLRREDHQLRAQALRLAVARAEQGDEPEQLHRAHGRQLPRGRRPRSAAVRCCARTASADLDGPDPDYVLTLDADSVLLPEYCAAHRAPARAERARSGRRRPDAVQRPSRARRRASSASPAPRPTSSTSSTRA